MTIVITILKIIGILFLVLLGLVILLVSLALFFPVGYSVLGISEEDVRIKGKIFWLFHAFCFGFSYEQKEFVTETRIFGIRLKKKEPPLSEKFDEYSFEKDEECDEEDDGTNSEPIETQSGTNSELLEVQDDTSFKVVEQEKDAVVTFENQTGETENRKKKTKEIHLFKKLHRLYQKICEAFSRFLKFLQNIKKKGTEFWRILTKEENKATLAGVFGELKYLLKHFRFRKIRSDLTFSAGDPALTGQILGGLCLLPFLYQKGVHIYPDFEEEKIYVKGELEACGHVRGIHILISGIRLWKDDNLRKLIKSFMK